MKLKVVCNAYTPSYGNFFKGKFELKYIYLCFNVSEAKIYKNADGKLCFTIYHKPTDQPNCLHFKSADLSSLRKSILYSQDLHISNISVETNGMTNHLADLEKVFLTRGYQEANNTFSIQLPQ